MFIRKFSMSTDVGPAILLAGALLCSPDDHAADRAADLVDLMRVDSEFNALSQRVGRIEGFLQYMADDALLLNRATRGKAAARSSFERTDVKGFRLIWGATYADVSQAGDLGYTLGVWHRETPVRESTEVRTSTGMFLTIWHREPDGSWKFVVDGVGNVIAPEEIERIHRSMRSFSGPQAHPTNTSTDPATLAALDQSLSRQALATDFDSALLERLADDAMLLDQRVHSRAAAIASLNAEARHVKYSWEPFEAKIARLGDLGYTWGAFRRFERDDENWQPAATGLYVNVWKRQGDGAWKIVVAGSAELPADTVENVAHHIAR
jgi:ketosteroid isomerase-like protein